MAALDAREAGLAAQQAALQGREASLEVICTLCAKQDTTAHALCRQRISTCACRCLTTAVFHVIRVAAAQARGYTFRLGSSIRHSIRLLSSPSRCARSGCIDGCALCTQTAERDISTREARIEEAAKMLETRETDAKARVRDAHLWCA